MIQTVDFNSLPEGVSKDIFGVAAAGSIDLLHQVLRQLEQQLARDPATSSMASTIGAAKMLFSSGDPDGNTMAHWAMSNSLSFVNALLDEAQKASIIDLVSNQKNVKGETPMHWAAAKGKIEILHTLLVENGSGRINERNAMGQNILHVACQFEQYMTVHYLSCVHDMDLNETDNGGHTCLHWAASSGAVDLCRYLVNRGASVNRQDNDQCTPLMRASMRGYTKCVKALLQLGADPLLENKDGHTPGWICASRNFHETWKLIDKVSRNPGYLQKRPFFQWVHFWTVCMGVMGSVWMLARLPWFVGPALLVFLVTVSSQAWQHFHPSLSMPDHSVMGFTLGTYLVGVYATTYILRDPLPPSLPLPSSLNESADVIDRTDLWHLFVLYQVVFLMIWFALLRSDPGFIDCEPYDRHQLLQSLQLTAQHDDQRDLHSNQYLSKPQSSLHEYGKVGDLSRSASHQYSIPVQNNEQSQKKNTMNHLTSESYVDQSQKKNTMNHLTSGSYVDPCCPTCLCRIPVRAKHCGVCQRCVGRLDHHCQWLGQCVGQQNHRLFILFLCSFLVEHTMYLLLCWRYIITQKQQQHESESESESMVGFLWSLLETGLTSSVANAVVFWDSLLHVILFVWMVVLLVDQLKNICRNTTVYEEIHCHRPSSSSSSSSANSATLPSQHTVTADHNPFDLGWTQNLRQFFFTPIDWRHIFISSYKNV